MNKLIRPDYARMYEVMRVRLSSVLGKCVFVLLMFHLAESFAISISLSPLMAGPFSFITLGISAVMMGLVLFVSFLFLYGILSYFTKVILAKKDVMRVFTSGFRDKTNRSYKAAFFFTVIIFASAVSAAFLVFYNKDRIMSMEIWNELLQNRTEESAQFVKVISLSAVFCIVLLIAAIVTSLPFIFTWNILFDDRKISFLSAVRKSFSLMIPNYFHFIGFVIYVCIKNIFFIVLLAVANMHISKSDSVIANLLSMVLGFFVFTQEYSIIAKAYAGISVYYYSLLSVNGMIATESKGTGAGKDSSEVKSADCDDREENESSAE